LLPLPHSIPDFLFCDDWFCPLSIRQQYPCREGVGVRFRRIHVNDTENPDFSKKLGF